MSWHRNRAPCSGQGQALGPRFRGDDETFVPEDHGMDETVLVQKVWNYAHVLRDQGVPYQAYISRNSPTSCSSRWTTSARGWSPRASSRARLGDPRGVPLAGLARPAE